MILGKWMKIFYNSPSWALGASGFVLGCMAFFVILLWIARKYLPHDQLRKHHDVSGFVFGLVGVLYSVILGFVVINVHTRYDEAEQNIHNEAMALADLYRIADFFPEPNRDFMRSSLSEYISYIIQHEWDQKGSRTWHLSMHPTLKQVWVAYGSVDVPDLKTSVCFDQSMKSLNRLMEARLSRAFNSLGHLSMLMWTILISGALLTLCFMFFFSLESFRLQMAMMALLAGYLSFMPFLVYTLDHVYEGPQAIQPEAFYEVLSLVTEENSNS